MSKRGWLDIADADRVMSDRISDGVGSNAVNLRDHCCPDNYAKISYCCEIKKDSVPLITSDSRILSEFPSTALSPEDFAQ